MDRNTVRIGCIIAGVLSALMIILYLPVLIWSPPWGENGYYHIYKDQRNYHGFHNGKYTMIHTWNGSVSDRKSTMVYANGVWTGSSTFRGGLSMATFHRISFSHNEMLLEESFSNDDYRAQGRYLKTHSPFTIWYIKWLEWRQR